MKILFDVNVPKGLRRFLVNHEVRTAQEQGWGDSKNGELLRVAEAAGFEAMVTADKNLEYQQNLTGRKLALVILPTNDWDKLRPIVPRIVAMVDAATPRTYQQIKLQDLGPRLCKPERRTKR